MEDCSGSSSGLQLPNIPSSTFCWFDAILDTILGLLRFASASADRTSDSRCRELPRREVPGRGGVLPVVNASDRSLPSNGRGADRDAGIRAGTGQCRSPRQLSILCVGALFFLPAGSPPRREGTPSLSWRVSRVHTSETSVPDAAIGVHRLRDDWPGTHDRPNHRHCRGALHA